MPSNACVKQNDGVSATESDCHRPRNAKSMSMERKNIFAASIPMSHKTASIARLSVSLMPSSSRAPPISTLFDYEGLCDV